MKKYSADDMITRAKQICKYEPEFNYDSESGMLQIWDYCEEYGQSFHREDFCRPTEIDLDDLFALICQNGYSYVTSLLDAFDCKDEGTVDTIDIIPRQDERDEI